MYKFEVELEDGTSGEVSAKTEDRWKVGDEVEYTVTPSKWGDRLKLDKAGYNKGGGSGNNPDIQKRIDASWAIGHAINQESDPEKIVEAAEAFLFSEFFLPLVEAFRRPYVHAAFNAHGFYP